MNTSATLSLVGSRDAIMRRTADFRQGTGADFVHAFSGVGILFTKPKRVSEELLFLRLRCGGWGCCGFVDLCIAYRLGFCWPGYGTRDGKSAKNQQNESGETHLIDREQRRWLEIGYEDVEKGLQ
jgi:hypothetical protein